MAAKPTIIPPSKEMRMGMLSKETINHRHKETKRTNTNIQNSTSMATGQNASQMVLLPAKSPTGSKYAPLFARKPENRLPCVFYDIFLLVSRLMFIFAKSFSLKRMAIRKRKWGEHFYEKVSSS